MRTMGTVLGLVFTLVLITSAREPKEGKPGPPDVYCGKVTNRVVYIGAKTIAEFVADKWTKRCTVLYKMTDCSEMELTCSYFNVDNRDPYKCKKGNSLTVRAYGEPPRRFCKRDGPVPHFPVLSPGNMKIWYKSTTGILGSGRYPDQGVKCTIKCYKE
eukprot:GFUD01036670.1.p1 GENE.GFUD01036670.1~~GFUD01036670.1.p1  ORF type:complete len:158 (-),score=35.81 GFUD01036670.1:33-506(-)